MEFNPVFLKEIRQMSRSRLPASLLLLCLLGAGGGGLLWLWWTGDEPWTPTQRPGLTLACLTATTLASALLAAGVDALARATREWSPTGRDLLFTTPLAPGKLALGKWLASLVLVGYLAALGTPFLFGAFVLRGFSLGSGLFTLAMLAMFGLLVLGSASFTAILSPPRVVRMLGLGYFLVFGLWRLIYAWMIPTLLPTLGGILLIHAILAWLGVWLLLSLRQEGQAGTETKPRWRGRLPRTLMGITAGAGGLMAAAHDFQLLSSRSELFWLAMAGHLAMVLGVGIIGLLGTPWLQQLRTWSWRRPRPPTAPSDGAPTPKRTAEWLLKLLAGLLPEPPGTPAAAATGNALYRLFDRGEWNPTFTKIGRSLARSRFFITYPIVVACFTLSCWGIYLFFEYVMDPFFEATFLIIATLPPLLFWSISYEIFLRGLAEWGSEEGHPDLVYTTPMKPGGILVGILAIGLAVMPLAVIAAWPALFFSKQYFWQNLHNRSTWVATIALASQAACVYLWTLAMALWKLPGHLKTWASLLLFTALAPYLIHSREASIFAFAGNSIIFLGLIHFFLTNPRHRHWGFMTACAIAGLAILAMVPGEYRHAPPPLWRILLPLLAWGFSFVLVYRFSFRPR